MVDFRSEGVPSRARGVATEIRHRSVTRMTDPAAHVLDNAPWHSLTGAHAEFAEGSGFARRYQPDVSVFSALPDNSEAGWADLADLVGPGAQAVLFQGDEVVPAEGWSVAFSGPGYQMVLDRELDDEPWPEGTRVLEASDVAEMTALVALTKPGPFQPRTFDLGGYLGVFDDGRLVAMAGQRLRPPGHTEISAVCTHPDARGRGLAGELTLAVARRILARGEIPFLHVAGTNDNARRVYERIGFVTRRVVGFTALVAP